MQRQIYSVAVFFELSVNVVSSSRTGPCEMWTKSFKHKYSWYKQLDRQETMENSGYGTAGVP